MTIDPRIAFTLAAAAVLALGMLFRAWGVADGALDFWADEAWWIANTADRSLTLTGIRPVGFQWLGRQLLGVGDAETVLRLPSLLAGIGALACVLAAARALLPGRALALVALALVAFHPKLIVFAKEYKPYALEVFLHAGLTAWALWSLRRRVIGAPFVAASIAAVPFAYNALFLLPGLALTFVAVRAPRVTPMQWTLAAAAAVAVAALLHGVAADAFGIAARRAFWAEKYGVFPPDGGVAATLAWYASRTWALLGTPVEFAGGSPAFIAPLKHLFAAACVAGAVGFAVRARWTEFALLAGPVLLAAIANALGYWPYGPFRTNLFLVPALALLGCAGFAVAASWRPLRVASPVLALVVLAAVLPWNPTHHRTKHLADGAGSPQLTHVLDDIARRAATAPAPGGETIVADWHSWRPLNHYLAQEPAYAALRGRTTLLRGPVDDADALAGMLAAEHARADGARVWLVVTKLDSMARVLDHALVRTAGSAPTAYAQHDARYHPVVVEFGVAR